MGIQMVHNLAIGVSRRVNVFGSSEKVANSVSIPATTAIPTTTRSPRDPSSIRGISSVPRRFPLVSTASYLKMQTSAYIGKQITQPVARTLTACFVPHRKVGGWLEGATQNQHAPEYCHRKSCDASCDDSSCDNTPYLGVVQEKDLRRG